MFREVRVSDQSGSFCNMHFKSPRSRAACLLSILAAAADISRAVPYSETSAFVGGNTFPDYKTSETGASVSSSSSRPGSSITATARAGTMTALASAAGGPVTQGHASWSAKARDRYTITGGTGAGTATFTFYVSGKLFASRTYNSLATDNVGTVDTLDGSEMVVSRDNTPTQDQLGRRFARVRVSQ